MGRAPCCQKNGVKKGPWTAEEDKLLIDYIHKNGCGNWRTLPNNAGLQRCGKSCRLRWTNYLRPDIKRGKFSFQEEETIIHLHSILGNKWSSIAARLPGRTDNEIKNYWNTHIRKRLLRMGIDPVTHHFRPDLLDLASKINSSNPTPFQSPCTNYLDLVRLTSSLMQLSDDQVQQLVQMQNPFNGCMIHEPAHQLMHYDDVAGFGSEQGASLLGECGYYGSDWVVVDPGSSLESCTFEVDSSGSFGLQSVFSNISTLLSSPTTLQF